jgi:selenide,water dikinase
VLVDASTSDDAAVYRLDDERALVFTTDFFAPIVDDPFDWGRIAAANALSDVYAMGGRPLLCLNIAGWPRDELPLDMLARVLEGGAAVARDAGAFIVGGHTVDDPEPKYGMAVVGLADPARIVTNAGARPGDALVLTKPLGIGVIATAIKNGVAPEEAVDAAVSSMVELNAHAAEAMLANGASAATDVSGFGLLGHLHELLSASGVAGELNAGAVPLLPGARAMAEHGQIAGGTRRNRAHLSDEVAFDEAIDEATRWLLFDAQTSGGLLIAGAPEAATAIVGTLSGAAIVGAIRAGAPGSIHVAA